MAFLEDSAEDTVAGVVSAPSFAEAYCLPFLLSSQNPDGGWGYSARVQSNTEATSWALMALHCATGDGYNEATLRGLRYLCQAQLADGSWPVYVGQSTGCWATSLACLALHLQAQFPTAVARGLAWLVETRPSEGSWWWRLRTRFLRASSIVRQDSSLRGWSWTPGAASWVEPTSYALILLHRIAGGLLPAGTDKRVRVAEAMLYDRMCPGGGWNSGNPRVYGVAGVPRVGPTVWALLALQHHVANTRNKRSLDWLQGGYREIRGAASLSLAHLCLQTCGRPVPLLEPALWDLYERNQFLGNLLTFCWATIALSGKPIFLASGDGEAKGVGV